MKIQLFMVFILVWCHFIADFLLQSEKMALNKSKSFKWLNIHAAVYGLVITVIGMLTIGIERGLIFGVVNWVAHGFVDFWTSKGTSILWQKKAVHWFFCLIGFDQALHLTVLVASAAYLMQ